MKRQITLLLTLPILLSGCGGTTDPTKTRIERKPIISFADSGTVAEIESFDVLFKANSEIPYVNLSDGARFLNAIRKSRMGNSAYCKAEIAGSKVTYSLENGTTSVIDAQAQTITFPEINSFFNYSESAKPLSSLSFLTPNHKAIKISKQEYEAGKSLSFDLKPYAKLDVFQHENAFYLPYTVYSDIFLSQFDGLNITYNFKDLYLMSSATPFTKQVGDENVQTALGKKFFDEAKKSETISAEYTEFAYDSLCFNLDNTYGLKDYKGISSFDSYFASKGYRDDLRSGNAHKMDNALGYAFSTLRDSHTARTGGSPLYAFGDNTAARDRYDSESLAFDEGGEALAAAKAKAGVKPGVTLESASGGLFINFNSFEEINEDLLYKSFPSDPAASTATLFSYAYKTATAAENKDKIKYVLVDMSTNDGGAIDALIYGLGVLLGEVHLDVIDPRSGAHNRTYYKVDINADGVIDEKDKSLKELGYKIVFLNSAFSFSSANAMPVLAKENDPSVLTVGEKTAGGPCAVRMTTTALGTVHMQSGLNVVAKKDGANWKPIEDGVAADHVIERSSLYDYSYVGAMVGGWINK